jgi:hypothetical protein
LCCYPTDFVTFKILPMSNLYLDSSQCFFNLGIKKNRVLLHKLKKQIKNLKKRKERIIHASTKNCKQKLSQVNS